MREPLPRRTEAEAVEQFGDDLAALNLAFDRLVNRMSPDAIERINAIDHQDRLSTIAEAFRALGDQLCRESEAAEEAEGRWVAPASTCIETIGGDPDTALRLSFQIKVF